MTLLVIYVLIAVVFSFLCSIAEAVLLSVTQSYVAALEHDGRAAGRRLRRLKADINSPLAVILSLNTIAHTVGAAGAGAQAAAVFGNVYLGVFSGILTFVILVFSEIIPKALGAHYWRKLAPVTAAILVFLVRVFRPFVWLSNVLTSRLIGPPRLKGFSRREFAVMADLGAQEGQLSPKEALVLKNLFQLRELKASDVMTPRPVIFSLPESMLVGEFGEQKRIERFSRIPIYAEPDNLTGFVLAKDVLFAQRKGEHETPLKKLRRELLAVPSQASLLTVFEIFAEKNTQIVQVIDEYGGVHGLLSMEDVLESLLGLEITDESDKAADLQKVARRLSVLRHRRKGQNLELDVDEPLAEPEKNT